MSDIKSGDRVRVTIEGTALVSESAIAIRDGHHDWTAGDLGEPRRHIEFEPLPEHVPVTEPTVAPEPEKVPA